MELELEFQNRKLVELELERKLGIFFGVNFGVVSVKKTSTFSFID